MLVSNSLSNDRRSIGLASESHNQIALAAALVDYRGAARYRFRGEFLFRGIPIVGARVLEIGCGTGAWAIWTALAGAVKVTGVEPEAEGSSAHSLDRFRRNLEKLGLQDRVDAVGCTLQDLPPSAERFDIAIMYNVINHLDEDAVVRLHKDQEAMGRYVALLRKLHLHMNPHGWVVVADCGRDNLWPKLGIRSPFMPSIEWQKHQNPKIWTDVFERAGFRMFDLRWSPLQPFPKLTGNRLIEYLTCSHFVLRFRVEQAMTTGAAA
jgi:SAM-dependent methyltransferase